MVLFHSPAISSLWFFILEFLVRGIHGFRRIPRTPRHEALREADPGLHYRRTGTGPPPGMAQGLGGGNPGGRVASLYRKTIGT